MGDKTGSRIIKEVKVANFLARFALYTRSMLTESGHFQISEGAEQEDKPVQYLFTKLEKEKRVSGIGFGARKTAGRVSEVAFKGFHYASFKGCLAFLWDKVKSNDDLEINVHALKKLFLDRCAKPGKAVDEAALKLAFSGFGFHAKRAAARDVLTALFEDLSKADVCLEKLRKASADFLEVVDKGEFLGAFPCGPASDPYSSVKVEATRDSGLDQEKLTASKEALKIALEKKGKSGDLRTSGSEEGGKLKGTVESLILLQTPERLKKEPPAKIGFKIASAFKEEIEKSGEKWAPGVRAKSMKRKALTPRRVVKTGKIDIAKITFCEILHLSIPKKHRSVKAVKKTGL